MHARCVGLGKARVRGANGSRQRTKLELVDQVDVQLVVEVGGNASREPAKRQSSHAAQSCGHRAWRKRSRGFNVGHTDMARRVWGLLTRTAWAVAAAPKARRKKRLSGTTRSYQIRHMVLVGNRPTRPRLRYECLLIA